MSDSAVSDDPVSPRLSAREHAVLLAYVSGLTLDTAARRVGIRPTTAKTYLARVKAKYAEVGRPARTKLELADRVREDRLGPDRQAPEAGSDHGTGIDSLGDIFSRARAKAILGMSLTLMDNDVVWFGGTGYAAAG